MEIEQFKESLSSLEFSLLEHQASSRPNKFVGGYFLNEIIGQGAYGKVYSAEKDSQKFAIKEITMVGQDPEKIISEIKMLAKVHIYVMKLSHPNITNYVESLRKGQSVYIVIEFVEGLTLTEYLKAMQERVD